MNKGGELEKNGGETRRFFVLESAWPISPGRQCDGAAQAAVKTTRPAASVALTLPCIW